MLTDAAQLYSAVFTPELFVLLCGILLIGYEWRGLATPSLSGFGARLGVLALGWAVGLAIYEGVPHLFITPFWDISTHVLYAVVPAGYLLAVNRRFVPLAVVAVGMVFARPWAGAHTWPQSIGGFVLGVGFVTAYLGYEKQRAEPAPF